MREAALPPGRGGLPATVWATALAVAALLVAVGNRYGFHRDELYFVAAGRRLDWGYVDQPPLTPLVARLLDALPGELSPLVLRVPSALITAGLVLTAAALAGGLGGGRFAKAFAALAVGGSGFFLGVGHLLSTTTVDTFLSAVMLLLVVHILGGGDRRWWLAVGAVVGVGMLNKYTIGLLVATLLVALLASRPRVLASPWPWAGAVLALVLFLPNLLWQAANGWPQLEMAEALAARSDGPLAFLLFQPVLVSVLLIVPAVAGAWWLWRAEGGRWRALPITFLLLAATYVTTGGKFYYLAPLYVPFLAAAGVWLERGGRPRRRLVMALAVVGILVGLPLALPLLPVERLQPVNELNNELGETVGWPQLVDQVEAVVRSLPEAERGEAVIFTGNYGEAGALELLAGDQRLPPVMSGHNSYWMWGPVEGKGPIIGWDRCEKPSRGCAHRWSRWR